MTDERPRPEYGEYATPQEQAEALGTTWSPPDPVTVITDEPGGPVEAAPPARQGDVFTTLALLALGLYNVLSLATAVIDLPGYLDTFVSQFHLTDGFHGSDAVRPLGWAAAVVLVVGFGLTAWTSVRRLRSGRLAFWVPLAGGAIVLTIVGVVLAIAMASDPALVEALQSGSLTPTATPSP
jgi:hypothetical protein